MKKNYSIFVFLIIVLLFVVTGCSSPEPEYDIIPEALLGTWTGNFSGGSIQTYIFSKNTIAWSNSKEKDNYGIMLVTNVEPVVNNHSPENIDYPNGYKLKYKITENNTVPGDIGKEEIYSYFLSPDGNKFRHFLETTYIDDDDGEEKVYVSWGSVFTKIKSN